MTILTGILKDPFENPVSGILNITLIEPKVNIEIDEILLPLMTSFEIIDGIIDLEIPESESYENNYLFDFIPEGYTESVAPFPFYGVIPDLETIDIVEILPIRKIVRDLNQAAFKVARLISKNDSLAKEIYNLNPVGEYDSLLSYDRGDIVIYDNNNYVCIKVAPEGLNPLNEVYWFKLSSSDFTIPDGSITALKLDVEVNSKLDLATNSLQDSDIGTTVQPLLGYTPENIANKSTNTALGISDILYPSQKAVKDYVDSGLNTKENIANKNINNGYCGLDSGGKVPLDRLPSTLLKYESTYNPVTNIPALISPDLTKVGYVYTINQNGTRFGIDWKLGDWLIYNSSGVPEKSDNSDDVLSVNGQTGVVVLNKSDVGLSNVVNIDTTTTTNITDSLNKRFVTDTQLTTINNTSGINTGDQINITGNAETVTNGVYTTGSYSNPAWLTSLDWAKITSRPTTLSGYGITDAQPLNTALTSISGLTPTNDDIIQRKGGVWVNRSISQLATDLGISSTNQDIKILQALGSTVKAVTYKPDTLTANTNVPTGTINFSLVYIEQTVTISTVRMYLLLAGNYTANNTNGVALYSISGTNLVKIAESANTPSLFAGVNNSLITVNLTTPVVLTPGVYVFGALYSRSGVITEPRIYTITNNTNAEQSTVWLDSYQIGSSMTLGAQTAFPSTIAINTLARSQRGPYARFY